MREFGPPGVVEVPQTATLTDVVFDGASERPDATVLSRKVRGRWSDVTAREFRDEVLDLAKGLVASGIQAGDRVALLSRTRYEWTLCDYAIWTSGAVTVPIYETSSTEQIHWILSDSGAKALFVEDEELASTVRKATEKGPHLKHTWQFDADWMDTLRRTGAALDEKVIDQRRRQPGADGLATVIYTSGTTGRPKGCEITHRNLLFDVRAVMAAGLSDVFETRGASILLFLPLAHVLPRIIQVGCLETGVRMGHTPDTKSVLDDLASFQPTFIMAVPRVLEKVYNSASQKAAAEGKGTIFTKAADTAVAYSEALDNTDTGGPGTMLKLKHATFDQLVYRKLRQALGGRVMYAVSGSAALGERLGHFFRGIGVPVLEGYGMTESSAAVALNMPGEQKIGTVGKPLPGTRVRIADDGEILVQGPLVFGGYWKNPSATKEIVEDGWLHTGDMGSLDEEGFLSITGRKKELLVTAGGKNVAPAVLEDRARLHPLVSQCMVVGDKRPYVAALVTLDPEVLPGWKERHGKPAGMTIEQLRDDPDLTAEVQQAIDDANGAVSRAESIRRFRFLTVDFTVESGHLTPSLKMRRSQVLRDFADEVEALYT